MSEPGTYIETKDMCYSMGAAIQFGGSPHDWTEAYKCWNCETVYQFENSNY